MTDRKCSECFHYGKSLVTSRVGCVLEERHKVDKDNPSNCGYFAKWEGKQ